MKVVLDTNVLLVAIPRLSAYFEIFSSLTNGRYQLCVTTDILSEYEEKLHEKYFKQPLVAENLLRFFEHSPDVEY